MYYDWLSIVHAFGGNDIREAEGRVPLGVGLTTKTVHDATELYFDLAKLVDPKQRFDEQIQEFASRKLAFYFAWTDSFSFEWDKGNDHITNVRPIDIPTEAKLNGGHGSNQSNHSKTFTLRFGQLPRDMRQPRTLVADGWIMTFPRKNLESNQDRRAWSFGFCDHFLEPKRQRELLRTGFPTSSLRVVQRELITVNSRRGRASDNFTWGDQCYETFLRTLQFAITDGVNVPSLWDAKLNITKLLKPMLGKSSTVELDRELSAIQERLYEGLKAHRQHAGGSFNS
jgi:hypothetical protein